MRQQTEMKLQTLITQTNRISVSRTCGSQSNLIFSGSEEKPQKKGNHVTVAMLKMWKKVTELAKSDKNKKERSIKRRPYKDFSKQYM